MRKALIVGIDYYENVGCLHGCVNDSNDVKQALERNFDGTLNFSIKTMKSTSAQNKVTRASLEDNIKELFDGDADIALLYFSGHGYTTEGNGYLITSDSTTRGIDGVKMDDVVELANKSKIKSKVIILDCCHAGEMATMKYFNKASIIGDGVTILSACTKGQYALENKNHGVFTQLFVDALNGAAADILGNVSPGGIYAYIDRSLGAWSQRPVFKTNVESFIVLRKVKPAISLEDVKKVSDIFAEPEKDFSLSPDFEPESSNPDPQKTKIFAILQRLESVNLVVPVGEEHMYFAAMNNKSCKLTEQGKHYWNLVKKGII